MPDENQKKQLLVPSGFQPHEKPSFWPIFASFGLVGFLGGFLVGASQSPVVAPFLTAAGGVGAGLCVVWFSGKKEERELSESQKRHLAIHVSAFALMAFVGLVFGAESRTGAMARHFTEEKPLQIKEYVAAHGQHLDSEDVAKLLLLQSLFTASGLDRNDANNSLRLLIDQTDIQLSHYEEQKRIAESAFLKTFMQQMKVSDDQLSDLNKEMTAVIQGGKLTEKSLASTPGGWPALTQLIQTCEKCQPSLTAARDAIKQLRDNDAELSRQFHALETNRLGRPKAIDTVLEQSRISLQGMDSERFHMKSVPCSYPSSSWTDLWSAWDDHPSGGGA